MTISTSFDSILLVILYNHKTLHILFMNYQTWKIREHPTCFKRNKQRNNFHSMYVQWLCQILLFMVIVIINLQRCCPFVDTKVARSNNPVREETWGQLQDSQGNSNFDGQETLLYVCVIYNVKESKIFAQNMDVVCNSKGEELIKFGSTTKTNIYRRPFMYVTHLAFQHENAHTDTCNLCIMRYKLNKNFNIYRATLTLRITMQ